jgi:nocardicin N-oxygenase
MTAVQKPLPYPFSKDEGLTLDPLFTELRERQPVCRVTLPYGGDAWLVTRYEDAKKVLSDRRFSRAMTLHADIPRMFPEPDEADSILSMDPPDHTRLRRLVGQAFTPRRIEQLRPRVFELVSGFLDRMERHGPPADVVEMISRLLPVSVICEVLGVPLEDRARFREWTGIAMAVHAVSKQELDEALGNLAGYIAALVAQRRAQPTNDLLGALVQARDDDEQLSEGELVNLGVTLLVVGHETTEKEIGNVVYTLLTHPDQLDQLRAFPKLIPQGIEELLRYIPLQTSVGSFTRIAIEDVELGEVLIRTGEVVFTQLSVANHDERMFSRPDELDVSRGQCPHLAFGHGPHLCLGSHLARMELQVLVESLLARFPGLRLAVSPSDLTWWTAGFVRGPEALPVAW